MHSSKIQDLLKAEPIRPPVRYPKSRGSKSPTSPISSSNTTSQKDILFGFSAKTSLFITPHNAKNEHKDDNIPSDDERISVILPQSNFNASDRESPNFRYKNYPVSNRNLTSRYSRVDNFSPDIFDNKDTLTLTRKSEKIITFGTKRSEVTTNSNRYSGKENNYTLLNQNEESYSISCNNKNPKSQKGEAIFTFESEEGKGSKLTEELLENQTHKDELQQILTQRYTPGILNWNAFDTQTINVRRKSQNVPSESYYIPIHRRILSEKNLEKSCSYRKEIDHSGFDCHLLIPDKTTIEERYCQSSRKSFYYNLLKDLEQIPFDIEESSQVDFFISKADKFDQMAFNIMQSKFGQKYAHGLYLIFAKYSKDNDMKKTKMTFLKFNSFMKDFNLFNQIITKELVSIIYAKRCPNKKIDFAAFIDILFKISKSQILFKKCHLKYSKEFQHYLDYYVLKNHLLLLEKQQQIKTPRLSVLNDEYDSEISALKALQEKDGLINHVFTIYESLDIQYHNKSILFFKDFKRFCYDYSIVPVLCTLGEAIEVFRRLQIGSKQIIDFKGFVMALVCFAMIGFSKEQFCDKYNTAAQKLSKFFDVLVKMNSMVSDQLVLNHVIDSSRK